MNKYLIGISVYNEGNKIKRVVEKFNDYRRYDVLLDDDGSTDGVLDTIASHTNLIKIRREVNRGAGFSVREILQYAKENGYTAAIFVAGNDKDSAEDVGKLIDGIEEGYDLVQGSRYLPGGGYGQMPLYRTYATKWVHPLLFSLITGKRITDSTNGFRAVRVSLLDDQRINLNQSWLERYELEPYLFFKAIRLGYKVKEVPVTKIYPPKKEGYTKMKPITGWWSILRPLIYLGLGIKK